MTNPNMNKPIDFPSGVTLFPSQDQAIDRVLNELKQKCPAQFVLLAEVSGQIISALGERGEINLVALGSLVAGDLAASQEIARLTDQYQNYQLILREGPKTNTFISEAGSHLVLFVRVDRETPIRMGTFNYPRGQSPAGRCRIDASGRSSQIGSGLG